MSKSVLLLKQERKNIILQLLCVMLKVQNMEIKDLSFMT